MASSIIAQKLWNYWNVLRDNEMSTSPYVEQLTSVLFFKMADEGLCLVQEPSVFFSVQVGYRAGK